MRTEELSDRPVGDLVQQLSQQTAALVRKEMRLAQVELQEKGKRAGIGAGSAPWRASSATWRM
jgi:membrane protein